MWGTLAGVLIFGILDTTFNQLGVNPYLKTVFRGAIIVLSRGQLHDTLEKRSGLRSGSNDRQRLLIPRQNQSTKSLRKLWGWIRKIPSGLPDFPDHLYHAGFI